MRRGTAAAIAVATIAVISTGAAQAGSGDDARSERALNQAAFEVNRSLPMMLDKDTEATSATGLPGVLVYSLRLVNVSSDQVEPQQLGDFVTGAQSRVTTSDCGDPYLRDHFLGRGVSLRYNYADKDRRHLASFEVKPADCGFK